MQGKAISAPPLPQAAKPLLELDASPVAGAASERSCGAAWPGAGASPACSTAATAAAHLSPQEGPATPALRPPDAAAKRGAAVVTAAGVKCLQGTGPGVAGEAAAGQGAPQGRRAGERQWSRRAARSQAEAEAAARARYLAEMRAHFAEVRTCNWQLRSA